MNNVKNSIRKNFTIAPNELITDNKITDRARFLFIYMCSKPDTWNFLTYKLVKDLGYCKDTLKKYLDELVKSGWILKEKQKRIPGGKFGANTYVLNSQPQMILPCRKNTVTVKYRDRKIPTHSNKEFIKKENKKRNNLII